VSSQPDEHDEDDEAPSILEAAKAAKASEKGNGSNRTRQLMTGAAIGVGSAALVAALLYANRSRKGDKS
jgi:hypothetical protein